MLATATEEQSAAAGDISANTQFSARCTEDVTHNIDGVGHAAVMTGIASTQLMDLSGNLSRQANNMQFVVQILSMNCTLVKLT